MSETKQTLVPISVLKQVRDEKWLIILVPGADASVAGVVNLTAHVAMDLGTDSKGVEQIRGKNLAINPNLKGATCSDTKDSPTKPLATMMVTYGVDDGNISEVFRCIQAEALKCTDTPLVVSMPYPVKSSRLNNAPLFMPLKRNWLILEVGKTTVTHISSSKRRDRFVKRSIEEIIEAAVTFKPAESSAI